MFESRKRMFLFYGHKNSLGIKDGVSRVLRVQLGSFPVNTSSYLSVHQENEIQECNRPASIS